MCVCVCVCVCARMCACAKSIVTCDPPVSVFVICVNATQSVGIVLV